jgi:hypothetical protein
VKRLAEKYAALAPHEVDYTALLEETNLFRRGRELVHDEAACRSLAVRLAEAEARLDLEAAGRCLAGRQAIVPREMKVSCELEYWAFFERRDFARLLYIGSGAYPTIALYVLERKPRLRVEGLDVVPHCTVLCSEVAAKLGLADRLRAFTGDGLALEPHVIARYDAFFLSSAVRPKNTIIEHLLRHKRPGAPIYAREDEAHPFFYEPVRVEHPDLLAARAARARWARAMGGPVDLPEGCEVEP